MSNRICNKYWIPAFAGMAFLFVAPARADCLRPVAPEIPAASASDHEFRLARVRVSAYLTGLDAYIGCLKDAAAAMKPVDALAAYREADRAYALMQRDVDAYDSALSQHAAGGS